jgi:hypothetical protein
MANINELIEKYFRAETSIADEIKLKQYFKSENIDPLHEQYRAMFLCFETEGDLKMPLETKNIRVFGRNLNKQFLLGSFSLSGIAAALILGFWFFQVDTNSDYARVNGQIIEDEYLAQEIANTKIRKVNKTLASAFQPIDQIALVKENLNSINVISKTRNKITEIKNTIQIKE